MQGYCVASCGGCDVVPEAASEACPEAAPAGVEATDVPFPRVVDHSWMSVGEWCHRHRVILGDPNRPISELVFLGDSITEGWADRGRDLWDARFGRHHPVNAGLGGDQTQHMLWRIEHGALDDLPQVRGVVLLAGVNNLGWGGYGPEDTARGIAAVTAAVRRKLPNARILVLGVFPANATPDDGFRRAIAATNALLPSRVAGEGIEFWDIGARFLGPDGSISTDLMYDLLHPDRRGYEIWADALAEVLPTILGR